ncbi:MAG: glucokinase [Rhodospirillales bacterium]|nr:glucokinase [Rhodospirillales bacterium]
MASDTSPVLLADIGGTNARFALARAGAVEETRHFLVAEHLGPLEAIRAFLDEVGPRAMPRRAALAFAGPVVDGRAQLTNGTWRVSASGLRRILDMESVAIVNDCAATAWALSKLGGESLVPLGGDAAVKGAPVAVICPGTGLGVAGFIPTRPRPVVIASEGGHVTMAPADRRESALLEYLRGRFEHVSAERVLSGPGLENLYQAVAAVDGLTAPPRPAQEIVARALAGDSRVSVAALDCFCAMLGTMAGNLALTFGARGGIYIGGGVVPRFAEFLPASRFRERFESKGRFATYLERIPAFVIVHPDPAFLGLEALVEAG